MFFIRKFVLILGFIILMFPSVFLYAENEEEIEIKSITAENISNNKSGDIILEGNVEIKSNLLTFFADKAIFNESKGLIELSENIYVEKEDLRFNSSELQVKLKTKTFLSKNIEIQQIDSLSFSVEDLIVKTSGNVELVNSSITSCSKEDPTWAISTKKITYLSNENAAIIKGIKLKIKNITVLSLPHLRTFVGNKKISGFLSPSLRQTNDGVDVSMPYYFYLAPNYDLEVAPRYMTSRGQGLFSKFRYINKNTSGEIFFTALERDKKYEEQTNKNNSRWNFTWKNNLAIDSKFFSSINFNSVSDDYFFRDIKENQFGQTKTNYLPKKISLIWKTPTTQIDLDASSFKILNPFSPEEYEKKPSLTIQTFLSKEDISLSLYANKSEFEIDANNSFNQQAKTIKREYFSPELNFKKILPSSYFSMSIGHTSIEHKNSSSALKSSTPWAEMEYKLFLDKINKSSSKSLMPIIKYTYTKENSELINDLIDSRILSFNYLTIFKRDRLVGLDSFQKSNKIILGIEHFSKGNYSNNFTSFSLGQAFYLKDEKDQNKFEVNSNKSPLVTEINNQIGNKLWSKATLEWDYDLNKITSSSVGLAYQEHKDKRIEIKSIYRRKGLNTVYLPWIDNNDPINQIELLMHWPVLKSFSFFSRLQKDLEKKESTDILFGFEYSNCCLKWGLMHRKWIQEDYFSWEENYTSPIEAISSGFNPSRQRSKTYVFFELKNIGRLGKEISKALSSSRLE